MSIGLIKKTTTHYSLRIPVFDAPGWGREVERNFDVIDAVLFGISNFTNVSGVWTNGTAYTVLDRVIDASDNSIWSCLVSHTSASTGSFADDRAANPTYWELTTTTVVNRGAWTAATEYNTNDFVYFDNQFGVVPGSFTSSASFAADVAAGDIVVLIDLRPQLAAAQADADAAATSAGNAAGSASAAGTSASAAADSATLAGTHATTANTKAGEAAASATAADASAGAAATSATNAANSASAAATSATNSANSATASDTSADASAASASAANTSATNSAASEALAEKWAEEAEDVEVETGKYSAKHHALKASASAAAIATGGIAGFRNKIINGDFLLWQRSTSGTGTGYKSVDRWVQSQGTGASIMTARQSFTPGQTDVPGNPFFYLRFSRSVVGSAASYIAQRIEFVHTLAGQTATLTFYAKAGAATTLRVLLQQYFGSGGSVSLNSLDQTINLTTSWQKFQFVVNVNSLAGKTIGTGDYIQLILQRNTADANPTTDVDIAHVSLVPGDASGEADPFPQRSRGQEWHLCQRYFIELNALELKGYAPTGDSFWVPIILPVMMRSAPTITQSITTSSNAIGAQSLVGGITDGQHGYIQTAAGSAGMARVLISASFDAEV